MCFLLGCAIANALTTFFEYQLIIIWKIGARVCECGVRARFISSMHITFYFHAICNSTFVYCSFAFLKHSALILCTYFSMIIKHVFFFHFQFLECVLCDVFHTDLSIQIACIISVTHQKKWKDEQKTNSLKWWTEKKLLIHFCSLAAHSYINKRHKTEIVKRQLSNKIINRLTAHISISFFFKFLFHIAALLAPKLHTKMMSTNCIQNYTHRTEATTFKRKTKCASDRPTSVSSSNFIGSTFDSIML